MIAIYARQSVERPDSISIAMQVEHCRRICPAEAEVRVFTDRGFTGTNTHRPWNRAKWKASMCISWIGFPVPSATLPQ